MTTILKKESTEMPRPTVDPEVVQKLRRFAKGELTWAEVEGWTWQDATALAQVGCDLAAAGRLNEALVVFEGMVEMNPKDAAARSALGTVYQRLGRPEDAIAAYTRALEADPQNPVALANRGELRLQRGDAAGGEDLVAAIAADPAGSTPAGRRALAIAKVLALAAVQAQGRGAKGPAT